MLFLVFDGHELVRRGPVEAKIEGPRDVAASWKIHGAW